MKKKANLPRCVRKYQLKNYFDCSYDYLWRNLITDDLLLSWGYHLEDIKSLKQLGPTLTHRIYIHFKITDLDANLSEKIELELQGKSCNS